jgi:hypothetical protein
MKKKSPSTRSPKDILISKLAGRLISMTNCPREQRAIMRIVNKTFKKTA